jgi:hypothetical protein
MTPEQVSDVIESGISGERLQKETSYELINHWTMYQTRRPFLSPVYLLKREGKWIKREEKLGK